MKFSQKQQEVFDEIMHFFLESDELVYIFSGVAGSGKSTIINEINDMLRKEYQKSVAVITLTGKAVSTLKDKGIHNAQTIHSYMYEPITDEHDNLIGFELTDPSELLEDFIIIDEGSMINEEIFEDVFDLGKKILVVGDENQLPPISKTNFNIMEESNFRLEEIHRLAEGNPIIRLSQHILEHGTLPRNFQSDHINFIQRGKMRSHLEQHGKGVICLRNDKMQGIFNGEMFTIHSRHEYEYYMKGKKVELTKYLIIDDKGFYRSVIVHDDVWGSEDVWIKYLYERDHEGESKKRLINLFDFGEAVTVWKAQGSEYQNLMFVDEDVSFFVDRSKFRYTGVTRSKDMITIVK